MECLRSFAPVPFIARRRTQVAFTLVEMLLVTVVLAVVAVLLLSVIHKASDSSAQVKNVTNLKTLGLASIRYAHDHNGMLPLETRAGKKQTTCRYGIGSGAAPLKLIKRDDYAVAQGDDNYVDNLDVFYSPFAKAMVKNRKPNTFYSKPGAGNQIGYVSISLPRKNEASPEVALLVPGLHNEHLLDNPRAPLYCDFWGAIATTELFSSNQCAFVAMDGSVNVLPQKELGKTWAAVLKQMAGF